MLPPDSAAVRGRPHCCPGHRPHPLLDGELTRRGFLAGLGGVAVGGSMLAGLSWAAGVDDSPGARPPQRRPLVIKPVLTYDTPQRRPQTSWRAWGGIETVEQAEQESARISGELAELEKAADFPLRCLPVSPVRSPADVEGLADLKLADAVIVYAAGCWLDVLQAALAAGKPTIFFVRHRSGPVYLWYEIIHSRFLRGHTDELALPGVNYDDVVVDSQPELVWRLRALCGLRNATGASIVAIGGPSGWECPAAPDLARERFKLDIRTVSYDELGELIRAAQQDRAAVARAAQRAAEYLSDSTVRLETEKAFVVNAMLLEDVFRRILAEAGAFALTINDCMGTIMPLAQTSACLALSLLNDAGYLAFCESDFVVIPSGILLWGIAGKPVFLNDPTYAHEHVITLAHCTCPRKLDGQNAAPARILTHFESDYGAAPKVEMKPGQVVTMIAPDFAAKRYMGLVGQVADNPFLPICRTQVDVRYAADDREVNAATPGFHWMLAYGDYHREVGYALRRLGIEWNLVA